MVKQCMEKRFIIPGSHGDVLLSSLQERSCCLVLKSTVSGEPPSASSHSNSIKAEATFFLGCLQPGPEYCRSTKSIYEQSGIPLTDTLYLRVLQ